jgi:hypothetical protein
MTQFKYSKKDQRSLNIIATIMTIVAFAAMLFAVNTAEAAEYNYNKETKTFTVKKSQRKNSADISMLDIKIQQGDTLYAVYVNNKTDRCFIIKTSKKTGKPYNKYLGKSFDEMYWSEFGITPKKPYKEDK